MIENVSTNKIDSGLGLAQNISKSLLSKLGINTGLSKEKTDTI